MMKHLFLFFFAMFFLNAHAQSNLPACASPPFNNCYGEWKFENGNRYSGEWANNKKNGQGTLFFPDGDKYIGKFRDDQYNGYGIYSWADGQKYAGQWANDKRNGQGTASYSNGKKYIGLYKDGQKNGYGTLYSANGTIDQQGIWKDGVFAQALTAPPVAVPVKPKPTVNNAQDIKRQKCIRLGLVPGSVDFQQCMD